MWRKAFFLVLVLLLSLPLWAGSSTGSEARLPDPSEMTDLEIVLELQQLYRQQQSRVETLLEPLPKVLKIVEEEQESSREQQISLGMLSTKAANQEGMLTGLTSYFQSYSDAMDKEVRKLRIQNNVLIVAVSSLVLYGFYQALKSWPP
jgi:hypothetical protein